jgi:hypothetical protein
VDPRIVFPGKEDVHHFSILGAWFPETFNAGGKPKYEIRFVGEDTPKKCPSATETPIEPCYTITRENERQITVDLRNQVLNSQSRKSYAGPHKISLLVGREKASPNTDIAESNAVDITLSRYGRELPRIYALGFLGVLQVFRFRRGLGGRARSKISCVRTAAALNCASQLSRLAKGELDKAFFPCSC